MQPKFLWIAGAAGLALTLPALAQQTQPQPTPTPAPQPLAQPGGEPATSPVGELSTGPGESETTLEDLTTAQLQPPTPPVEYPANARRDPNVVGALDPQQAGLGASPWGGASGTFLSTLMRRMDTPIASRWAHIALRDALLAKTRAPRSINPVDWVAERAWLLLRLGEADAARMAAEMTAHVGDAVRAEVRGLSREWNPYAPDVDMHVPSWVGQEEAA